MVVGEGGKSGEHEAVIGMYCFREESIFNKTKTITTLTFKIFGIQFHFWVTYVKLLEIIFLANLRTL